VCCNSLTVSLVKPFSFNIPHVDAKFAGKRVGEYNTQLFSWHWPGDDESILLIVESIVDTTILVNPECCNLGSPRPQPEDPRALGMPGGAQ